MTINVDWIFFDLGSTLLDESGAERRRMEETVAGSNVTYEAFFEAALDAARRNENGYKAALERFGLTKTPWRPEEETLYPETRELLKRLSGQYRLGVIANQEPGAEQRLERFGIRPFFDVIVCSAESGVAKPDPRIFLMALEQANCPPERAAMVGDRLDNDVIPAKELGMRTVWVRQGMGGLAVSRTPEEGPDVTIDHIDQLFDFLKRQ